MSNRITNLLSLCMEAKTKGHDCFFDYAPHIDGITIKIYKGGWKEGEVVDNEVVADFCDKTFRFDLDDVWTARQAEEYLKGLI